MKIPTNNSTDMITCISQLICHINEDVVQHRYSPYDIVTALSTITTVTPTVGSWLRYVTMRCNLDGYDNLMYVTDDHGNLRSLFEVNPRLSPNGSYPPTVDERPIDQEVRNIRVNYPDLIESYRGLSLVDVYHVHYLMLNNISPTKTVISALIARLTGMMRNNTVSNACINVILSSVDSVLTYPIINNIINCSFSVLSRDIRINSSSSNSNSNSNSNNDVFLNYVNLYPAMRIYSNIIQQHGTRGLIVTLPDIIIKRLMGLPYEYNLTIDRKMSMVVDVLMNPTAAQDKFRNNTIDHVTRIGCNPDCVTGIGSLLNDDWREYHRSDLIFEILGDNEAVAVLRTESYLLGRLGKEQGKIIQMIAEQLHIPPPMNYTSMMEHAFESVRYVEMITGECPS